MDCLDEKHRWEVGAHLRVQQHCTSASLLVFILTTLMLWAIRSLSLGIATGHTAAG